MPPKVKTTGSLSQKSTLVPKDYAKGPLGTPATLTGHTDAVNNLVPLPKGQLASDSYDESRKVWDFPALTPAPTEEKRLMPSHDTTTLETSSAGFKAAGLAPALPFPNVLDTAKAAQPTAGETIRQSFNTLPLAEFIRACDDTQPHCPVAQAALIKRFNKLKELDLSNARLTKTDIKYLVAVLVGVLESNGQPTLSLQRINASQNALGDDGLIALFPLLQTCAGTLQELNLANSALTSKSILGLIKSCLPKLEQLFALDVTGNNLTEKVKTTLQAISEEKGINLEIDPAAPMPSASLLFLSSLRSNHSGNMRWGRRQTFFEPALPTEEEKNQLRDELDKLDRHSSIG